MRNLRTNLDPTKIWLKKAIHTDSTRIRQSWQRILHKFTEWIESSPEELMSEWRSVRYNPMEKEKFLDQLNELIENYYATELEDYAPLTRQKILAILKSFLHHNHIPAEPNISDRCFVKYHNRAIKKTEVQRILEHSSLRDKTFFLMMVESGQRPNTLVQLRFKHIKEDFQAERVPMKIDLDPAMLKDRVGRRFTFIGQDGFNALKEYLSPRLPLEDEDLIFISNKGEMMGNHLTTATFSGSFKRKAEKLGLTKQPEKGKPGPLRLYCLRKYFRNHCQPREPNYRKFWMSRSFGTDEHYLNRDPSTHRKAYAEVYPEIRIYEPTAGQEVKNLRSEVKALRNLLKERPKRPQEEIDKEIQEHAKQYGLEKRYDGLRRDFETLLEILKRKGINIDAEFKKQRQKEEED